MDGMSLSAPTTFGASRFYVRKTVKPFSKSIKYTTKWIIKRGNMFWILLSFWETRKLDFLPPIRHFNEWHACAAAATRVKYKIVHKKIIQIAAAGSLMYTQVLLYTHLHSCTASTLMYGTCRIPPPLLQDGCPARLGTRARLGSWLGWVTMGRVTALSQAVTTVTWMSHGSHEPDVDESRLEQAGLWYQCLRLSSKQTNFALGQHAGSEPDVGSRTASPSSGTCPAHIWPQARHKLCPYICQVRRGGSIMGNNVKNWLLLHILTC